MIETIYIRNVASFDSAGVKAKLHKINLLIGKNLTGKSNFMTAIKMSCTKDGKNYEVNGRETYNNLAIVNEWLNMYTNMLEISKNRFYKRKQQK
jgi:AAA15 family ATPase/GTPase